MSNRALLIPITDEARVALAGRDAVEIDRLPFRIGRESRVALVSGELKYMERRKGTVTPNNDLYLYDSGDLLNISREHLQIDINDEGEFIVHDRGSACGTHVDGVVVGGGDTTGTATIHDDSEITIGMQDSPYRFRVSNLEKLRGPGAGDT